jgi:hypothetical protein
MSVVFAGRPGENISSGYEFYIYKTGPLNSVQVLSLQESATDSSSP